VLDALAAIEFCARAPSGRSATPIAISLPLLSLLATIFSPDIARAYRRQSPAAQLLRHHD